MNGGDNQSVDLICKPQDMVKVLDHEYSGREQFSDNLHYMHCAVSVRTISQKEYEL